MVSNAPFADAGSIRPAVFIVVRSPSGTVIVSMRQSPTTVFFGHDGGSLDTYQSRASNLWALPNHYRCMQGE